MYQELFRGIRVNHISSIALLELDPPRGVDERQLRDPRLLMELMLGLAHIYLVSKKQITLLLVQQC